MATTLNGLENQTKVITMNALGEYDNLRPQVKPVEATHAQMVAMRDQGKLIPGQLYRITDYVTTTVQENTRSAGHPFDIIVMALDATTLSENAWAIQHDGDTYFANCNLAAWKLRYTLDNINWSAVKGSQIYTDDDLWFESRGTVDIDGETWYLWYNEGFDSGEGGTLGYVATRSAEPQVGDGASVVDIDEKVIVSEDYSEVMKSRTVDHDGFGTILWMKDEFNNECPYDFKNIQYKRYITTDSVRGRDGLGGLYMVADPDNCPRGLSVEDTEDFIWAYTFSSDNEGGEQTDYSLTLAHNVYDNVMKPYDGGLPDNVMFGEYNFGNSFGVYCSKNSLGNRCSYNSLGNNCAYNSLGNGCSYNSLGNRCYRNSWGTNCSYNSLGNNCYENSCGNEFYSNFWGNHCYENSWGDQISESTLLDNVHHTKITTSGVINVLVLNGVGGRGTSLTLAFAAQKNYPQVAAMTSAGVLKIYVPGDLA